MDKELVVLVNETVLGFLRQARNGRLSFCYTDEWMARIDAFPLSLSMPLALREHSHHVAHAYLNGLLPESDAARRAIARHYGLSSTTAFKLAAAMGEDLAGAVQVVPPDRLNELKRRQGTALIPEARLGRYLDELKTNPGALPITEDAGRFSLGGVQAKKAVYWVNNKWYEPRGRTPSTHIIKPPIPWLDAQVENEHFCLRLAERLGLSACRSEIVRIHDKPNIVVWRYDRQRRRGARVLELTETGGSVVRIHQEDMCQALGVEPVRKYQEDGGPGMKAIMALLSGSGRPTADRRRFMAACLYNFIILGTDAHAKNYSVLIDHSHYRLAPLYDINSVLPYESRLDGSRKLAMSVGGQNKWRAIALRDWEKAADECGYPFDELVDQLTKLLNAAPDAAASVLNSCQAAGLDSPILVRLADQIARRCGKLKRSFEL